MSRLVTDLTPGDLEALQAAQQAEIRPVAQKFTEAVQPAYCIHPNTLPRENAPPPMDKDTESLISESGLGEYPPGTRIVDTSRKRHWPTRKVYHQDPKRYEKAKADQPDAGEKPLPVGHPHAVMYRMKDGSVVMQIGDSCCTTAQTAKLPGEK